ncbi:MAG: hypothetical protein DRI80_19030, partial [Chloroflexota bacterium]
MRELKTRLNQLRIRGQGMVEFALVLPVLLLLLFGLVEFGRIFHAWLTLEYAARQAARYAASGALDKAYCAEVAGLLDAQDSLPPGTYANWDRYNPDTGEYDAPLDCMVSKKAPGLDSENPDDYW